MNLSQIWVLSRPRFIWEKTVFTRGSSAVRDFLSMVPRAYTAVVPWPPIIDPRLLMKVEKSLSLRVILLSSINPVMPRGAIRIPTSRNTTPALIPSNAIMIIAPRVRGIIILSMACIVSCSLDPRSIRPWDFGSSGTDVYMSRLPPMQITSTIP